MKKIKIFCNNRYYILFLNDERFIFHSATAWENIIQLLFDKGLVPNKSVIQKTYELKQAFSNQLQEEFPDLIFSYFGLTNDDENFEPETFIELENNIQ